MELTTRLSCSACAQVFRLQDVPVVQAGGQVAEEQKYLIPAAIQLGLQRQVPMMGQRS